MLLPIEIYLQIMENLDYSSLLVCMEVSSVFRDLVVGNSSLQYIIELAVAGQLDGSQSNWSSTDRLGKIRKHQSDWKKLKWGKEYRIPMADGSLWELCGGVLAQTSVDGTIILHQLPSEIRSIEEKQWTIGPEFTIGVREFGMDPSQDLLVLIEDLNGTPSAENRNYSIHLRTLSTGKTHPLATNSPILTLRQTINYLEASFAIQVSGKLVALLVRGSDDSEFILWDWKSGTVLFNTHDVYIMAFSLLSDECVVFCAVEELFGDPTLVTANFQEEGPERRPLKDLQHVVIYSYPDIPDRARLFDMDIRADPGPLWQPGSLASTVPFSYDSKDFVFAITLWFGVDGVARSMIHFIARSLLLRLAERARSTTSAYACFWDSWGAGNGSRLFIPPTHPSTTWVCYVYGKKYVVPESAPIDGATSSGFTARLLDFNQMAIQRDAQDPYNADVSDQHLITDFFGEDVGATMPYRSSSLHLEDAHGHCQRKVLCSEDNVIIVDPSCREYRVLVF